MKKRRDGLFVDHKSGGLALRTSARGSCAIGGSPCGVQFIGTLVGALRSCGA